MKKRIKIFETGMYPQGIFNKEKVKNIFGDVKEDITGIFSHTSQWTEETEWKSMANTLKGKTPVDWIQNAANDLANSINKE